MVPTVNAQVQQPGYQCSQCPQGQQLVPMTQPQPQYVPQQPVLAAPVPQQPTLTISNITDAITSALDPINKHLAIQDAEIANITTTITKLQTSPPTVAAALPPPPPPTTNSTAPLPPPGEQQNQSPQQGSACPQQGGGGGGGPMGQGGYPINQYFGYPGGYGPHFGNFNGSHSGGGHRGR